MLHAYLSSDPVLAGNNSGFYHLLGVLAIAFGAISLVLVARMATPRFREARWLRSLNRDPFDDSWKRQQDSFVQQVMQAEPDTLADTLVPGVEPVALPPDTGRPSLDAVPVYGVVVDRIPEQPADDGDTILEDIRRSNREFLAKLDSI